jgi:hypothetical protein
MSPWKDRLVLLTLSLLSITFPIFLVTGYTALYWAWLRDNLPAALPYLPWARNFGVLAIAGAAAGLGILFSSNTFPVSPKTRLALSLLATLSIGFFAEFRNEGKFHFRELVHFLGPGTWVHVGFNHVASALGDSLYRIEYSYWNDFLMGPAIASVLFSFAFVKIYRSFRDQGTLSLGASITDLSTDLDHALRFSRTLMNVGLFCFFFQAWAEKAGYLSNPHSSDEIDLPFEFAGTMVGFWMARGLTKPFDQRSEKFRSNFLVDFLSSGVIGLLYTLIVSRLTEQVANAVAHSLFPVVLRSLEAHEYTLFQRHMRPFELLLLAGAMWWGLNRSSTEEKLTRLADKSEGLAEANFRWEEMTAVARVLGVTVLYLVVLATMLSLLEPQGLGWTLIVVGAGVGAATAALFLVKRAVQQSLTTVFGRNDEKSGN